MSPVLLFFHIYSLLCVVPDHLFSHLQSPVSSPESWEHADHPRPVSKVSSHGNRPRRPRKLPDIPKKNSPATGVNTGKLWHLNV